MLAGYAIVVLFVATYLAALPRGQRAVVVLRYLDDLSERELEVLLVLVRGESNQAIAEGLGISAKTVGHHVQHVHQKAGVRSRDAATLWAFEHDLVRTA